MPDPVVDESSLIFPSKIAAVAEIRRDRLVLLSGSIMPDLQISDDYIWSKLVAAEATIAHMIRVPLVPTRFFPLDPTEEQIAELPAGQPWDVDPGYDYSPDNYYGDKWGMIVTRQKPVQSIIGMKFVYPSQHNTIVDVPREWLRADKRAGQVQIVPTGTTYTTMLGSIFLSSLTGGRQLPFTIMLDYVAGIKDINKEYPDLVDAVKKMAALKLVEDAFLPQSGSISADGLSQSSSVDTSKYHDSIDRIINGAPGGNGGIMAKLHGVRCMVM